MANDWRDAFSNRVLERGYDYWESGLVSLGKTKGKRRSAIVSGTSSYTVSVPVSGNVEKATCTCPHFEDGHMCKHIAAVMFSLEQEASPSKTKSDASDLVSMATSDQLRGFLRGLMLEDDTLERRLRAYLGIVDLKQAKSDIRHLTTDLMRRHERGGFIDWRHSMDFAHEYLSGIQDIVEPFKAAKDVDGLIDLAILRYVQLQRIRIDDSNGFFTEALHDVDRDLRFAAEWAKEGQLRTLFKALGSFLKSNPGKDSGSFYWAQEEHVREFLTKEFTSNPQFAKDLIAIADERIVELPPMPSGLTGYDINGSVRRDWELMRLLALSTTGASYDELMESPGVVDDRLLDLAEVVRAFVNARLQEGSIDKALDLLQAHLDSRNRIRVRGEERPQRLVDWLIELTAKHKPASDHKLLLVGLLQNPPEERDGGSIGRWYDTLHAMTDERLWPDERAALLASVPAGVKSTCLAHEGSLDELFDLVASQGSTELLRYEGLLAERHPAAYVDCYLEWAYSDLGRAYDRNGYRYVARNLKHAAEFEGGRERAQAAAEEIVTAFPRKTALADELRKAGFAV